MAGKIFLAALLSVLVRVSGFDDTYRGAVVEYNPVKGITQDETMEKNVKNYIEFMKKAKAKGADIIVFPENGLASNIISPIPDPADRIAPCDLVTFTTTKAVKDLSCASKNNSIYSVVNLREKRICTPDDPHCPPERYYTFNTNVVFDRYGVVIARYAKYNLFDESNNQTEEPELVFFDTDFGVRFGTFICFDILFSTPAQRLVQQYQIKNFVFTTHWFSELPFLTALQMQRGWAEANNVNLLASGYNDPKTGSGGSGIYNGKYGHIAEIMPETKTSKLLIADIPKLSYSRTEKRDTRPVERFYYNTTNDPVVESSDSEFHLLKDQMFRYKTDIIEHGKVFDKTICAENDFCCDFHVNMKPLHSDSANYTFRAMAFNGVRKFGMNFRGGVQFCGVVLCDGTHVMNCTSRVKNVPGLFKFSEIRIKGNFNLRNSFQMPSTLIDGGQLKPLPANKYEFSSKRKELISEVSLELLWPVDDLHTFAIWGRDFTRDMEPEQPIGGTSALVPMHVIFASIISFLVLLR